MLNGGFDPYAARASEREGNVLLLFAAARSSDMGTNGGNFPGSHTNMGSKQYKDAKVPGLDASARSIACAPRLCPTPTSSPLTSPGVCSTRARRSSANLPHRSASLPPPVGAVDDPCARNEKVITRTPPVRPPMPSALEATRMSSSTAASHVLEWKPFA